VVKIYGFRRRSKKIKQDLENLLEEVNAGEFGDFSNHKYPAPKIALADKLLQLRTNVIDGKYD